MPVLPGARAAASGAETLTTLAAAIEDFADAATVDDVQRLVHRAARRLTGADGATLIVREGGQCHYVDEDAIAPLWKGSRFPLESCISGWAMRNGEPALVEDVYADPRIPQEAYRPTFVKSLLIVPIGAREAKGAIGLYWARRHRASEEEVAAAWRATIRANDVLARYGGEEFAVLLAGCEDDVALEIAERLREATIGEQTVSIGLARCDGAQTAARLVERADRALYVAKNAGRNRVVVAP